MKPTPMHIPEGQDPNLTHTLWAMDMDIHGNPVLAHRIVKKVGGRGGKPGEVRVTACGLRLDAHNHPEGWWQVPNGDLPVADVARIHCGLVP